MPIALLRGDNFRLYRKIEIEPHPTLNLIVGDNAAGKTTLLEALFVAGRGRSFRAPALNELCGAEGPAWTLFMQIEGAEDRRIGVGWTRDGLETRLDDERGARLSDIVRSVPMQVLDPQAHRLLEEGPTYRRSFVDWGVFHVEHRFLEVWRRYQRALRQRNGALRAALEDRAIQAWDEELAQAGEEWSEMRAAHLAQAAPGLSRWSERLLGTSAARYHWARGWSEDVGLRDVLALNLEQHRRLGSTVQGPHRAELKISVDQAKAKGRVSRGQQKMLIAAMVLAQAELLSAAGAPTPVLLLDDFGSELAPEFQSRLAAGLALYPGQKFITAFEKLPAFEGLEGGMFHVEHGTIRSWKPLH
jgi:DNA replication and repair protein RecF